MPGKRIVVLAAFTLAAGVLAGSGGWAQGGMRWKGSGGWGPGGPYGRLYDPKTVETVKGEVIAVAMLTPMKGMGGGVHVSLKTEKETLSVHLGPSWFIENQDFKIAPKDTIEVKGSRVTMGGKPALIAAEVKKGDETLTLRDDTGVPVWSASRRRP
jgi:hypothetical protein